MNSEYSQNSLSGAINRSACSKLSRIGDWVESLTSALVFVIILFACIFRVVMVDGHSMDPTLNHKDRLIISSLFANPQNDDIVVVMTEGNDGHPIIKRVMATAGQTLEINYQKDTVTVTGSDGSSEILLEPYINESDLMVRGDIYYGSEDDNYSDFTFDDMTGELITATYAIPEGKYFVMGDNRNNSKDSRYAEIGMVSRGQILGEVMLRVTPLRLFGIVE